MENKELVLIDFGLARFIDNEKYKKDMDYWFMADFLIHLYYSSYEVDDEKDDDDKPWYEELDLTLEEKTFLRKLMGIEDGYNNLEEIRKDFNNIISKV